MCVASLWIYTLLFLFHLSSRQVHTFQNTIRVDGFFEPQYKEAERSFKWMMQKVNLRNDGKLLVAYNAKEVTPDDSFDVSKKVCKRIAAGCKVIFGPSSRISTGHVQSICNFLAIPHIQAHWDPRDITSDAKNPFVDTYSLNLYPYYLSLSGAYRDLIKYWDWKRFTIIYDDNDGLIRLQDVLGLAKSADTKIIVRKLDSDPNGYLQMFKELKKKGEYRLIIDCDVSKVGEVLQKALTVTAVTEYFHYFFTTLDLGLVDLESFSHNNANITAFRLVDPNRPYVADVLTDWKYDLFGTKARSSPLSQGQKIIPGGMYFLKNDSTVPLTQTALMYDAVNLFSHGLKNLLNAQKIDFSQNLSCNVSKSWDDGFSLFNYMKTADFEGLTGRVHFGQNGVRSDFVLDIVELGNTTLEKIGTWNPKTLVNITKNYTESREKARDLMTNKTFKVVTVLDDPYVFRKTDIKGNVYYEGFCIDLLDAIKREFGFEYVIEEAQSYGTCSADGVCDGMVKKLKEKEADLAVAGMTITYEREEVIDFTKPFLNLGITILFRKPKPEPPKLFSFLSPLDIEVWVYIIAGYLCVSFMLFVIARFTPYEWCNPHPCDPNTDVVENQFSILNSLWFTIGAFMQQGCEIAPRAVSTRLVAGCWWFFTLIIISSYTANLAAFLTVERMVSPIEDADDLVKQTKIKYGTLDKGSTKEFFKRSNIDKFKRMWSFMDAASPSVFVDSQDEGVERVKKGDYAYFAESSTVEYKIARECELMQVGGWLDSKGYGIALPEKSIYRDEISSIILKLQEDQKIQQLYDKWWKEKNNGGKCLNSEKAKATNALTIKNVAGVFVVLIGGTVAGVILAFWEFLWKARKNAKEDKQTLCSEMGEELRFAVRCFGSSTKPVKRKPSYDVTDNGLQSMPLQANTYSNNKVGGRELYT